MIAMSAMVLTESVVVTKDVILDIILMGNARSVNSVHTWARDKPVKHRLYVSFVHQSTERY